ncbi:hypothetical protein N7489_007132 [Penicillium chrysogenum]|uniref:uncharacterized protein n=1 Tax=Penicillium chrysogenum TaxID=5076 RepID=UPI0024DF1DEF|nr:uncharacterized protein N7489_007132 [Penicillium chrysogenum]KAJ5237041.1 hypothetical protein N7489_007132 [Penicillium chrysogenum]
METPSSGTTTPVDLEHGDDQIRKRLTVTFRDLNVRVTAPDAALGSTLWSEVDPRQVGALLKRGDRPKRTILKDVAGQVKPGEMLLVLGRPGSGCTSLLRVLSNDRDSFDEVTGETNYGSMDHKGAKKFHDVHFPTLTVNRTMKFALRNKVPNERPEHLRNRKDFVQDHRDEILESLGIGHTKKNLVGNEYIRGVSGGERKRVSLAEVLAGQSPVQMWDNPTRGLDSKSAVEFARMLRREADRNDKTIITTTYQAGNGIYDQFDKVLVLAEGRVTYYGPRRIARKYFEDLGFICPKGANIADFLTSVTVVTERTIRSGWEEKVPNTPEDFETCYQNSSICKDQMCSIVDPEKLSYEAEDLQLAVTSEKRKQHIPRNSSVYTANLWDQIAACALRQFQVIWGDKLSLFVKVGSALIQALVCGSLFYNMREDSSSIFLRPGVCFFPVLYFLLESLSETTASFMGRPILSRQKRFGFYRPTAFAIANAITDVPVVMFQVTCFSIILYFMAALQMDAGKFFTFWIIIIAQTLCFVQLFRSVGAVCKQFGNASKISGLLSTVFFVYGGYLIPFQKMHVWFRWIFYLNPGSYAFEALMANEFVGRKLTCIEPDYLPYGPGYSSSASVHRGCSVLGSDDHGIIDGAKYIQEQYSYSPHHIWRSFGILIGLWVFFIFLTSLGLELRNSQSGSSVLLYKRGSEKTRGKEEGEKTQSPKQADVGPLLGSRKRVTLGVELVAKPTLLFLDEPTSGLDGQSAFNIVRFLRKLVDGGQAVLCTIHQPSAVLFDAFDGLLLLAKGGRMTYFGETLSQLDALNESSKDDSDYVEDTADFATSHWFQFKTVSKRLSIHIWRSPDYMWNKIFLHIFAALFSGFTFWKIGNGTFSLQLRLFAIFNFIFVAPGCINQMQPFFLHSRDIFETREKKSKTYHWSAFIGAQTLTEIPYLIICATLYFACWYFTAGLPVEPSVSGHVYLQMIFYELLYTSIGQAIAAYAPNEYFAAVMNPVLIGAGLVSFCGVVVPYSQMQPFWRYWIYYLDPFNYLVGGLFGEVIWDVKVKCEPSEFVQFTAPPGQTCGQYMADFLATQSGYLADGNSTGTCSFCPYSQGSDYAKTFNLQEKYYSWRDTGITALFCISSYSLVFLMMKLRSKKTKSARSE